MTSDEVLAVLIDIWRQREGIDANVAIDCPISRQADVESVANACGLGRLEDDWIDIAWWLQHYFCLEIDKDVWREHLEPKHERAFGPVCDLIAEHALAPAIEREFGSVRLNWQAAAFRTVLLILEDAGADSHGLTPQSRLTPLLHAHGHVFQHLITRLAPGRLPPLRTVNIWLRVSVALFVIAVALWGAAHLLPQLPLGSFAGVALLAGIAGLLTPWKPGGVRAQLGDLETLHDLCCLLTSPPPPETSFATGSSGRPLFWSRKHHPHWHEILAPPPRR